MKRIILFSLFLSFFGFSSALALDFTPPPHNVPFEYGGDTFTWIFQHQTSSSESWVFYCKDTADEPTIDFYFGSWSLYYYWRAGGGYGWYENGYCRLFVTYDNGSNWDNLEYGGTTNAGYWVWGVPDLFSGANANLRSNRDIAYNGYPYPDYTNTNFQVSNLNTGDILVSATSFGGFTVTKQLNIIRSPQYGGGVVITPPQEFPIFQCGTEGQEECDLEVNLNGQVTLQAVENEGYAFSHWEINNQTMEDTDGIIPITMNEDKDVVAVYYLDLKLPLVGGKSWELHTEVGGSTDCSIQVPDSYHTGSGYYSLDFDDYSEEYGQEVDAPVLAAAKGIVVSELTGWHESYGWTVVLDHGCGYRTRYAHMKNEPTVSGTIEQGQQIGIIGTTGGTSTGTHLHFQVYYNGSSASTILELGAVKMEGVGLSAYAVGCHAYYESTNAQ